MQCVLWLTKFKSVTRVHRRVRTEWNVVTGLPNSLIRTLTKGITHTVNSVFYHYNLMILASLRYQSSRFHYSYSPFVIDFDVGGSTFYSVRTRRCTRGTYLNSANQNTHCLFYCGAHIFTDEISAKSLSSEIDE
ncbi:UNVERIFIED_CONTAM: hypothetical protein NCL1_63452 [Trichonephila clavipes]